MDKIEFRESFSKRILDLVGNNRIPFGPDPVTYAGSVAGTYWSERYPEGLSPEQWAESLTDLIKINPHEGEHLEFRT